MQHVVPGSKVCPDELQSYRWMSARGSSLLRQSQEERIQQGGDDLWLGNQCFLKCRRRSFRKTEILRPPSWHQKSCQGLLWKGAGGVSLETEVLLNPPKPKAPKPTGPKPKAGAIHPAKCSSCPLCYVIPGLYPGKLEMRNPKI